MIRKEFYEDFGNNQIERTTQNNKISRTIPNIQSFISDQKNNFSNGNLNQTCTSAYLRKGKQDMVIAEKKNLSKQSRNMASTTPSKKSCSPYKNNNVVYNRKTPKKEELLDQKLSPKKDSDIYQNDYQMVKLSYFQSPFVKKNAFDSSQNKLKDLPELTKVNSTVNYPSSEKKVFSKTHDSSKQNFMKKSLRSDSNSISREVSADHYFRGHRINSNDGNSDIANDSSFKIKSNNRGYNTDSISKNKEPKKIEFNKELESQSFVNRQNQAINEISSLYITNSLTSPQKKFGVGVELKRYGDTINKEKFEAKHSEMKLNSLNREDSIIANDSSVKRSIMKDNKNMELNGKNDSPPSQKKEIRKSATRESSHSKRRKINLTQKTASIYEITNTKVNSNTYDVDDGAGVMSEKIHASNTKNSSHTENLSFKTNGKTNSTLFNSWCLSDNYEVKPHVKNFFTTLMKSFDSSNNLNSNTNSNCNVNPTSYNSSELQWIVYQQLEELIISFDDLEIDKQIGTGGNSCVYLGTYRFCEVAIKRMCLNIMSLKEIKQVLTEIACMKKIRHPNIAMIIGISIDSDDYLYMILEYYQYQNMQDFYQKNKAKIKLTSKMSILFDIAKAINYLHYNKPTILHRDQKPQNIFIGQDKKPKLGDFGLAKGINSENESTDFHNTETTATLNYMSPESMSKSVYTEKSDIYSFGVTCWEFIHENEAFGDLTGFELIQSIVILKKRPPIDQRLNDGIKSLISDCWDDNPDKRPNSKELCFRLKKIISEMKQS